MKPTVLVFLLDLLVSIGFLIGVYTYWPDYRKPKQTFKEFRRNIGHLLCQQAINGVKGFSIKVERGGTMETFLGEKKSKVGAAEVVVGCVAQYIKLVPSDK